MDLLKCIAVDDEPHALELLEAYVEKVPFLEMQHTFTNPWDAIKVLKETKIDLLFLDIQMDEITGLQLLDLIGNQCPVIITSAYKEYALEGYKYQVSDYLLKPFSFDRFLKAVNNVMATSKTKAAPNISADTVDHIFVKGDGKNKFHQIKLSDIYYVVGLKNYVQFHCKKENIVTLQNMKDLESNLPTQQFMRVHRSYIINIDAIEKIDGHSIYIKDETIPVGQSYRDAFYEVIKNRELL